MSNRLAELSTDVRFEVASYLPASDVYGALPSVARAFANCDWGAGPWVQRVEKANEYMALPGWGKAWIPFREWFPRSVTQGGTFAPTTQQLTQARRYFMRHCGSGAATVVELCAAAVRRPRVREVCFDQRLGIEMQHGLVHEEFQMLVQNLADRPCSHIRSLHLHVPMIWVRASMRSTAPTPTPPSVYRLVRQSFPDLSCLAVCDIDKEGMAAVLAGSDAEKAGSLTSLDVTGPLCDEVMLEIGRLPQLRTFTWRRGQSDKPIDQTASASALSCFEKFAQGAKTLRHLSLVGWDAPIDPLLEVRHRLPTLWTLQVSTADGASALVVKIPNLKGVDLDRSPHLNPGAIISVQGDIQIWVPKLKALTDSKPVVS